MSGATPGPWRAQGWVPTRAYRTWTYIPIKDARNNLIASMYPDRGSNYTREQVEANARLIAAAPELLETLQHAIHWHDQLTPADIARYEAVIAKAGAA